MNMTRTMEMQLRRKELPWDDEIWNRIDRAVHDECQRTKIASKFLPMYGPIASGELTIPSDKILLSDEQKLAVDEADTERLLELVVEFTLTRQQVEREAELGTAVTLATRAANLISQAEDVVIFQGQLAIDPSSSSQHPLFSSGKVIARSGPAGIGLLNAPEADGSNPEIQKFPVKTINPTEPIPRWGENNFGAVSTAYSRLQSGEQLAQAHYGPYVCVENFEPYADSYAPLATTLILPADRIKPLVTPMYCDKDMYMQGNGRHRHEKDVQMYGRDMHYMYFNGHCPHYYGTGTLPRFRGIFASLGGNTMDLVVGVDAKTEYLTQDVQGNYCFRVYERFALRLKDPSSVIRLEFEGNKSTEPVSS